MKHNLKRIFALAAALIFGVTAIGVMPVSAQTQPTYTYTDPYVLAYEGSDSFPEHYQPYCKPYLYSSPHTTSMDIRNLETGRMESWICSQNVYNMIDTSRLEEGGEGAFASLEVYCTDACINAEGGASYRRINLEDASYFDDATAGRIRAVFLSSFPYIKDMSQITGAVNAYMESLGGEFTPVAELTAAEVVTAAQYTIWLIANGSDVYGRDNYRNTERVTPEELAEDVVYVQNEYMDCTEGKRETTENNINLVQKYLQNLAPVAPQKIVISENVLSVGEISKTKAEDGTYSMTVPYRVNAQLSAEDELILTVRCGETCRNILLTNENLVGSLELTGVKSSDDVVLEVNGYQVGGDVYLYDATENRENSQSMVGYDRSRLPVHGEVIVESGDHVLQIFKTTGAEEGKTPLANIVFDVYQVANMEELASGKVTLGEEPSEEELEKYRTEENRVTTLITDAAGFASFNFTENGKPDGVYLVAERPNAAVLAPIAPFYVAIPGTTDDGTGHINAVKVYPKNTTETGPQISKDVTQIDQDHDTFDVDAIHTWIIRGGVPAGMADAIRYEISDTLDYRLTYKGNVQVKVGQSTDEAGEETLTLQPDTHYVLTETVGSDDAGNPVKAFRVALTEDGRKAVAEMVRAGTGKGKDYEVRVYFDAVIDSDAQLGVQIPNSANLDYTNALGIDYASRSDEPEVHTGGTAVLKLNSKDDSPLAGAAFQIAREATEAEMADESVSKQILRIGDAEHTVVFAQFYATADLTGEKTDTVTTDEEGAALLYGLAYGQYYLVETKAPAGFNLLDQPIAVQIHETSHEAENIITVYNSKFTLPETGGMGTTLFTVTGIAVLSVSSVLLLTGKKKKTS